LFYFTSSIASGVKARADFAEFMYGLKPVFSKTIDFLRASLERFRNWCRQEPYNSIDFFVNGGPSKLSLFVGVKEKSTFQYS
jgi:hypothetical protein